MSIVSAQMDVLRERWKFRGQWVDYDHFDWMVLLLKETSDLARAVLRGENDDARSRLARVGAVAMYWAELWVDAPDSP